MTADEVIDAINQAVDAERVELTGSACDGRELAVVCSFKPTGAVLLITAYEGRFQ